MRSKLIKIVLAATFGLALAFTFGCSMFDKDKDDPPPPNQTPAAYDFSISGIGTFYYDGEAKAVTVAAQSGKTSGIVTVYYAGMGETFYEKSETAPTEIGEYIVAFDVAEAAGWNGASGLSAGTLSIEDGTPDIPSSLSAAAASGTSIKISWGTVSRATSYNVYYATEASESIELAAENVSGASFTHTGLTQGAIYYYYATAVNEYGESDYSASEAVKISAPVAPVNLEATAEASNKISLRWGAVSGAASYKVYYTTASETEKKLLGTYNQSSINATGTSPNTTYYFYIVAVNAVGESGFSEAVSVKTFAANFSVGLKAELITNTFIHLSWNRTSNSLDDWELYCSVGSPDNFTSIHYSPLGFWQVNASPNTTYYFYVKHWPYNDYYGNYEREGHSEIVSVTTGPPPPPPSATPAEPIPPLGGGKAGKLTISGYPYAASSTMSVRAYNVNISSLDLLMTFMQSGTSQGSGIMQTAGAVTWGSLVPPNGSYTIVVGRMVNKETSYYKATGVSITDGNGSVAWSRFSLLK